MSRHRSIDSFKLSARLTAALCLSLLVLSLTGGFLSSCSRSGGNDPRLLRASALASDNPREALAILDSVCPDSLSDPDRHLYDFLTVKARDKAYITHTSDSLILGVIAYTENHRVDASHRAEALYYGGRVYSDLGDYPTALEYFQAALDALPSNDDSTLSLRTAILSQNAQLFDRVRLYSDAIKILEEIINIESLNGMHREEILDLQSLGLVYQKEKRFDTARHYYNQALKKSEALGDSTLIVNSQMYLGEIEYYTGNLSNAKEYIGNVMRHVGPVSQDDALRLATRIYRKIGEKDSAYIYAKLLLKSSSLDNRHTAYAVLLSKDMHEYSDPDSLLAYIDNYKTLLSKKYDKNEADLAINQANYYNYRKHEKEIEAAKNDKEMILRLISIIIVAVVGILIGAGLIILINRRRQGRMYLKVKDQLTQISTDVQNLSREEPRPSLPEIGSDSMRVAENAKRLSTIESLLRKAETTEEITVRPEYVNSEILATLREMVRKRLSIPQTSEMWEEIRKTIEEVSPNTLPLIRQLTRGGLSYSDMQFAMLDIIGLSTAEIMVLLTRTRGTIDSRRVSIGQKLFDRRLASPLVVKLLRLI